MSVHIIPIYVEQPDGREVEYQAEFAITGRWTRDTFEEPGESPEAELRAVLGEDGQEIPPADYERLGLTKERLARAEEAAFESRAEDARSCAEAEAERDDE